MIVFIDVQLVNAVAIKSVRVSPHLIKLEHINVVRRLINAMQTMWHEAFRGIV